MVLQKEEKERVLDLVSRYRETHDEIETVLSALKTLHETKDLVLEKLEKIRNEEKDIKAELTERYGAGKLDPSSLEWININNKQDDAGN